MADIRYDDGYWDRHGLDEHTWLSELIHEYLVEREHAVPVVFGKPFSDPRSPYIADLSAFSVYWVKEGMVLVSHLEKKDGVELHGFDVEV